jgi:hypothetical protein
VKATSRVIFAAIAVSLLIGCTRGPRSGEDDRHLPPMGGEPFADIAAPGSLAALPPHDTSLEQVFTSGF